MEAEANFEAKAKEGFADISKTSEYDSDTLYSERDVQSEFGIKSINDYIGVQKAVISTLEKDGFFSNGKNIIINADSNMVVEITKDGIRETLGPEMRFEKLPRVLKELKLLTIKDLPQLIETSTLSADNVKNRKNPTSELKYAYLTKDIAMQNGKDVETYTVTITVRKSTQKNKFWVHEIRTTKKEQGLSSSTDANPQQEYNKTLAHADNISQKPPIVNTQ